MEKVESKFKISEYMKAFEAGDVIIIRKDADGNWTGIMTKFGKDITVRDVDPGTVLTRLITHE